MSDPSITERIRQRLAEVIDPELRLPITQLGMVGEISVDDAGAAQVGVKLTIAACPMRSRIVEDVTAAAVRAEGVSTASVQLGVMTPEERAELKDHLRGGETGKVNRFAQPENLTRVYAVASGKGGVGKSSVTVNLACAMAAQGLKVGIVDADIHGFSVPDLMGITDKPTRLDEMILPPVAYGVKTISIGMFVEGNQAVAWRGPMLHRAVEQFLTDVHFGDLDVLLLDLPPGTGDIAISVAQLLPGSELLVVTTPQVAASSVAERAGALSSQTKQRVAGVIENMGPMTLPDGSSFELFGSGGGQLVADRLSASLEAEVPLLGSVPLDMNLREAGDDGEPVVLSAPDSPAGVALRGIASRLAVQRRGISGRKLPISPV
ncbi:Mrp/NBP35 family ATP-binding protein [Nesterenkonia sandarakina]|uniref:Iron-sulfur cluster carrier protein n=1 Tax=Nesterenkonia sandarakina TaxID=272918 RepID=A0A2T0YIL2_9MICC|nr:P-loop NTPase [Nesterenkonia sandarakina]PRZ14981.1 ATP-binding protein involved in chromosome partitioning [Nesterenkonia sandarakina]